MTAKVRIASAGAEAVGRNDFGLTLVAIYRSVLAGTHRGTALGRFHDFVMLFAGIL